MANCSNIYDQWKNFLDTKSDQRTTNWFLMNSPIPVLIISIIYLITVKVVIPKLIENRKAFDIKQALMLYNFWHLSVNIIFFYYASKFAWFNNYSWRCEPVDRSPEGIPLIMAKACWWFLMFKITDFLETIILVCGKRYELITRYHIAHHFLMPSMIWGAVKFVPGGHATFFGFVNSFSHIIMYSYLFLIGVLPKLKQNIPWFRPFRIALSSAEIVAVMLHTFQLVIKNDCNFPMEFVYYVIFYSLLYLTLSIFCHYRNDHYKGPNQTDRMNYYY